jgi:hypothetical protein
MGKARYDTAASGRLTVHSGENNADIYKMKD